MQVLAVTSHAESLREELTTVEVARQDAVTKLVDIVGRAEAAQLLDLPERSLRHRHHPVPDRDDANT
jgi:hypothetical protein